MKFEISRKLGFNLEKIEDIKEEILKRYGVTKDEVENLVIEEHKENWIHCSFELDRKEVNADYGQLIFEFDNSLLYVNGKKIKIEYSRGYSFKALKTKLKTDSYQNLLELLNNKTFLSYSYEKLVEIYS